MIDEEKTKNATKPFTIKRNIVYQCIYFPLIFTIFVLVPFSLLALVAMFSSPYTRDYISISTVLGCFAVVVSFLSALILAKKVRAVEPKNAEYNRLAIFVSLAINTLVIFVAYIAGGISAAKVAACVVNPAFLIVNSLLVTIYANVPVVIMPLSYLMYAFTFLLFTRKAFGTELKNKAEGKRKIKLFPLFMAIITTLALSCGTFMFYPEMEYELLKAKYDALPFTEEVDFRFNDYLPFRRNNHLVTMDGQPTLDFLDINTTPRLDGATAFYPVYAAIAQNLYSGLESALDENYLFYENGGQGNIYLYSNMDIQDDSLQKTLNEILQCRQTSKAYEALVDGNSDMVFAFMPSDDQIAYAQEKSVEFQLTPIGYDAFCFFVNTQNPVNNLTVKQIQKIYSGKITNWKKVGGKNKRIFAFTRPKNSGSQTVMENLVMKDISISTRFEAKEVKTMGWIIKVVDGYLNTPASIGYTFMYYSSAMVESESIKYIAVDGVAPTADTVRSGEYAFSTPFYAVTVKGRQSAETLQLLNWLQDEQGQSLIRQCGYVGL